MDLLQRALQEGTCRGVVVGKTKGGSSNISGVNAFQVHR
jgi:hypothetical protein